MEWVIQYDDPVVPKYLREEIDNIQRHAAEACFEEIKKLITAEKHGNRLDITIPVPKTVAEATIEYEGDGPIEKKDRDND